MRNHTESKLVRNWLNAKVLSTGSKIMWKRWKVLFLILLGLEGHVSQMVWSQARAVASLWGKISFPILLGAGVGRSFSHIVESWSFFSYCWKSSQGESHFSHGVGNWWKVAFRMLGIGGHSFFLYY
jgi:hypothetical protein